VAALSPEHSGSNWNLEVLIFEERGKRKTSWGREEDQQQNFSFISSKSMRHLFTNLKRFQKLPWL